MKLELTPLKNPNVLFKSCVQMHQQEELFSTAVADLASAEDPFPVLANRKKCSEVRGSKIIV